MVQGAVNGLNSTAQRERDIDLAKDGMQYLPCWGYIYNNHCSDVQSSTIVEGPSRDVPAM